MFIFNSEVSPLGIHPKELCAKQTFFFGHHVAKLHHFKRNVYFLPNKNNLFLPNFFISIKNMDEIAKFG